MTKMGGFKSPSSSLKCLLKTGAVIKSFQDASDYYYDQIHPLTKKGSGILAAGK